MLRTSSLLELKEKEIERVTRDKLKFISDADEKIQNVTKDLAETKMLLAIESEEREKVKHALAQKARLPLSEPSHLALNIAFA